MDVAEFLLARIAEDPDAARERVEDWIEKGWGAATMDTDPEWVEDMVEIWLDPVWPRKENPFGSAIDERDMCELATLGWSEHPDFDPAWRI